MFYGLCRGVQHGRWMHPVSPQIPLSGLLYSWEIYFNFSFLILMQSDKAVACICSGDIYSGPVWTLIKPVFTETKQRAALVHVALVYGRHGKSSPTWTAVKACGHSAVWIHSIILQSVILVLLLGTFSRRQGQLYMDLTVCNKAMQAMGQFAIQFNKNRSERMRCHNIYIFSLLGEV